MKFVSNLALLLAASLTEANDGNVMDLLGSGLDLESLQGLEGLDISQLLGSGMMDMSEGVDEDVKHGYTQEGAKLDPISVKIDDIAGIEHDREKYTFQAETSRLMDIIVNSLYSNREVFLRELISNASDALTKVKHERLSRGETVDEQLAIYIECDKEKHTLSILDNGIGMKKEDMIQNLGTIARSGSHAFLESLADNDGDLNVIGQFGVGFYSAFLVADDVIVQSSSFDGNDEYLWRSQASEGFTIVKVPEKDIEQGTRVTLMLKPEAYKYSKTDTVERLIRQHSEFIDYPVFLKKKGDWVHVNPAKPIWQRNKSEVEEDEYKKFYRKLSKDYKSPLKTIHYNGEGEVEFKSILYIPDDKDPSLFGQTANPDDADAIKLYSRGVLISQEKSILPQWLGFVKGVVESNDLPLKVDREQLSSSKEMAVISKRLTKKVIDTFASMMKDDEEGKKLWTHYKTNLMLGSMIEENKSTREKIAKMFRFHHLLADSPSSMITMTEFIQDDEDDKSPIFYLWSNSPEDARGAPVLELFRKKAKDVLLVHGTIADQALEQLKEFNGRPIVSIEKGNLDQYLDLEGDGEMENARAKMMKPFLDQLTETIRGFGYSSFDKVELTEKLVESPSAIFASGTGVTAAQEKHIRNQSWFDETEMGWRLGKKILSINPSHPIVKSLFKGYQDAGVSEKLERGARMLYDFALLAGGHHLEMPELISELLRESIGKDLEIQDPSDYSPLEIDPKFYEDESEAEAHDDVVESEPHQEGGDHDEL